MSVDAIVAGHICLDVIPTLNSGQANLEQMMIPGRLSEVGSAVLSPGGPVSNTGLALHRLGIKTRLMGKVGNDVFGQAILEAIESEGQGLTEGMAVMDSEASSYTVILSPPDVDRIFLHHPGCNDTFAADDLRYDMLEKARLFHFGYPPIMKRMYQEDGAELVEIFRRARRTGVTTSLDMAMPDPNAPSGQADWKKILKVTLPHVDLFLPSVEEMLFMLQRDVFDALSQGEKIPAELVSKLGQELIDMGVTVVGLKAGELGLYLRTADEPSLADMGRARPSDFATWADRELWSPCFETAVAGTTGAGDATIAGFLSGLLRDMSPEQTLTAACAVGACNVEAADSLSGIRSWSETLARIADGWPRRHLFLNAPGWRFDPDRQLWIGPADAQGI
ncbi:MAG: carbohydrate kinase family protein [Candidatus Bipolaricaulia bacterium]